MVRPICNMKTCVNRSSAMCNDVLCSTAASRRWPLVRGGGRCCATDGHDRRHCFSCAHACSERFRTERLRSARLFMPGARGGTHDLKTATYPRCRGHRADDGIRRRIRAIAACSQRVAPPPPSISTQPPKAAPDMQMGLDALAGLGGKPIETLNSAEARTQPLAVDGATAVMAKRGILTTPDASVSTAPPRVRFCSRSVATTSRRRRLRSMVKRRGRHSPACERSAGYVASIIITPCARRTARQRRQEQAAVTMRLSHPRRRSFMPRLSMWSCMPIGAVAFTPTTCAVR